MPLITNYDQPRVHGETAPIAVHSLVGEKGQLASFGTNMHTIELG
jgi:hypothetical protein